MKRKKRRHQARPQDYERQTYGPLVIERSGRALAMHSRWTPAQFAHFRETVKKNRPDLKRKIDAEIAEALSLIQQFDPLGFILSVSLNNLVSDPEQYRESTYEGRECYAEYTQSLILARDRSQVAEVASQEVLAKFEGLVKEIFNDVRWFFGSEAVNSGRTDTEKDIRFVSLLNYLFLRGDSYPEHHQQMLEDIFRPHDAFLKQNIGFDSGQVFTALREIEDQLNRNLQQQQEVVQLLHQLHELFKEFLDREGAENFASPEECWDRYLKLPAVVEKRARIDDMTAVLGSDLFRVVPSDRLPLELLKRLSAHFGDNASFAEFAQSPAWPTNDSIVYDRPLIEDNGTFYCFSLPVLFRHIGNIVERWIQDTDAEYYQGTYQKMRSNYLEQKALDYLGSMLPGSTVWEKLFYWIEEGGITKRVETDGLIFHDENLFIVEARAGGLSLSARRGSVLQVRRDVKELIDHAYEQAKRTRDYILNAPQATFEYQDSSQALTVDKHTIRNIYLVNVTLQNLGLFSTRLHSLRELGLLRGKEWPWSVFINDLKVISEIIEFPSEFLNFLQRRIEAYDYPQLHPFDELDLFMFYLAEGLYFEDGSLNGIDQFSLVGYTEQLDRYYDCIAGRVSSGAKPTLRVSPDYQRLIRELESSGRFGFTRVTTALLSVSVDTHDEILKNLEKATKAANADGKAHDFTLFFKRAQRGLTFGVAKSGTHGFVGTAEHHCEFKMYQTHFTQWMLVIVELRPDGTRKLDFRVYEKKWLYDQAMEDELVKFKQRKMFEFARTGKTVSRNAPCPCNSGLKYKRCCGR